VLCCSDCQSADGEDVARNGASAGKSDQDRYENAGPVSERRLHSNHSYGIAGTHGIPGKQDVVCEVDQLVGAQHHDHCSLNGLGQRFSWITNLARYDVRLLCVSVTVEK